MRIVERTLIIIKPDAVNRGLVGEVVHRFERKGIKIIGMKMEHLSDKVSTSALLVYDFAKSETPASWYREFEGEYKFSDGVRAFGQVRFAGDPSAWNPTYVAGVKFCPVGEKTFF